MEMETLPLRARVAEAAQDCLTSNLECGYGCGQTFSRQALQAHYSTCSKKPHPCFFFDTCSPCHTTWSTISVLHQHLLTDHKEFCKYDYLPAPGVMLLFNRQKSSLWSYRLDTQTTELPLKITLRSHMGTLPSTTLQGIHSLTCPLFTWQKDSLQYRRKTEFLPLAS